MSWDVHQLAILFLISIAVISHEVHCRCVPISDTQQCDCPNSCPNPSSCQEKCVVCKRGYYGPSCVRRCKGKSHCLEDDCVLLPSGRALNCSEGCKTGWRGLSCNTNCKHPCRECNRYNGECIGRCRDGYYGSRCYERCNETCSRCEKESGTCTGCIAGYYGSKCLQPCPDECDQCHMVTGECVSAEVTTGTPDEDTYRGYHTPKHVNNLKPAELTIEWYGTDRPPYHSSESVYVKHEYDFDNRSDEFVIILAGALGGVACLVMIVIPLLLWTWRHKSDRKQNQTLYKQDSTDSSQPLTQTDPEHVYDEIKDNPKKKPLFSGYITPISHSVTHKYRSTVTPIDSKYITEGYLSPIYIPTRSKPT